MEKVKIQEALAQLDPADASQWTNDGQPKLDVLSQLLGETVKRQQVADAAPHFSRENPTIGDDGDGDPESGATDTSEAKADELEDEIEAARAEVEKATQAKEQALAELHRQQARLDEIILKRERERPSNENELGIRMFLKRQHEERVRRAEEHKRMREMTGLDKPFTPSKADEVAAQRPGHGDGRTQQPLAGRETT